MVATAANSSSIADEGSSSSQRQARASRTRKRGRVSPFILPPSSFVKTHKPQHILGFCPPYHHVTSSPPKNLSLHGLSPLPPHPHHLNLALGVGVLSCTTMENNNTNSLVTLPLLPYSPGPTAPPNPCVGEALVDLNTIVSVPEERDLLQQLQKPAVSNANLIQPQPVRPIGSSISVLYTSNEDSTLPSPPPAPPQAHKTPKRPHELEQLIENETLPVVISDSNHRIRMENSAYKEMVGQPLCPIIGDGNLNLNLNLKCKRISGEVTLNLRDSSIPTSSNGFSCWVMIEWQSEDNNKMNCVNAFCDVSKLACVSRDYLFAWRFHTRTPREASQSSCNSSNYYY